MDFGTYLNICEKPDFANLFDRINKKNKKIFIGNKDKEELTKDLEQIKFYQKEKKNCDTLCELYKNFIHNKSMLDVTKSTCDFEKLLARVRGESSNQLKSYAESFSVVFGKSAIKNMTDNEFLNRFFRTRYNVTEQFKTVIMEMETGPIHPKVRDGTSVDKGLVYCALKNKNRTGWWFEKEAITELQALDKAKTIRESFIDIFEEIERDIHVESKPDFKMQFGKLAHTYTFDRISKLIKEKFDIIGFKKMFKWFKKYLFILYPNVFYDCIGEHFVKHTMAFLEVPNPRDDYFECCKRVCDFAAEKHCDNYEISRIIGLTSWRLGLDLSYDYDTDYDNDDEETVKKNDNEFTSESKIIGMNKLLYGIPGCGKSKKLEDYLLSNDFMKDNDNGRVIRTTFHPDYSNADFVGQILPIKNGENIEYKIIPGPFTEALFAAYKSKESGKPQRYALVIEEINRGNAAAIFGDVFQLLDREPDGSSQYSIHNQIISGYFKQEGVNIDENIVIPSNLFLFATMNSSDQNVFKLDTAFKRRWRMWRITNKDSRNAIIQYDFQVPNLESVNWSSFVDTINKIIVDNGLEEDRQIGYWFCKKEDVEEDSNMFANKVVEYLWNDVTKYIDKNKIFKDKYKTFDEVIEDFSDGNNVFSDSLDFSKK